MIGTLLKDRYRIDVKLGEGGMGVVYKAQDTLLDRPVAIKAVSPHLLADEGLKRLLREAQSAAKLTHPNIVAIYDVIDDGDQRLIVMEYIEGQTLRSLIPISWERAIGVTLDLCRALAFAHDRGIVHRDIKPENIIVTPEGPAKVMDFGLARSEGRSRLTQTGMIVGTVAYMAPEQVLRGEADARSDLYSLGCVLYETLTGKPPFESDDPLSVISQHLAAPPVAPRWTNPQIPATLDTVVMKLLAKDPAGRYPSAAHLLQALEELRAAGDTAVSAPSLSMLEALRRSRFVGRDRELHELKVAVDRMLGGEGGTIFVVGEPGIGKTRICQETTTYARLRGCRVWSGQAYEREAGLPYGPFVEAFKLARSELAEEDWPGIARRWPELAKLLPEVTAAPASLVELPPEQERARLFEQVAQLLAAWARQFPIVLTLDDLHWADQATLELLRYLARVARGERILLIGTYRDVEVGAAHSLARTLGDMNRERLYQRVLLRRLEEAPVATLIAAAFDEPIARALLRPVYQETEGNPFFIEEVLKDLVETGAVFREDGRWGHSPKAALRVPESIREAVGRRIARFSEACRQSLTVAAVIGREFAFDVLQAGGSLDEDTLLAHLDEALAAQLIHPAGSRAGEEAYTFQHALIRETLYDGLNPRRRARLHRQVGEAYEQVYAKRQDLVVDDLAYHFGRAEQGQADKGIRYNVLAAERAAAAYAHEGAEARLRVALELAESLGAFAAMAEIHERLGDLHLRVQEGGKAIVEFELALQVLSRAGPVAEERALYLQLKVVQASAEFGVRHAETRALAESLIGSPVAGRDARFQALALDYLALLQLRAAEYDLALATGMQALDVAASLGDVRLLSHLYKDFTSIYWELGQWDQGYAFTLRRLELANQIDDLVELWDVHTGTAEDSMIAGRYQAAQTHAEQAVEIARKIQSPKAISQSLYNMSWVYHGIGKWRESVQFGEEGLALGQRVGALEGNLLYLHIWVGLSAAYLGDEETTRRHIAACEALAPQWRHGRRNFVQARLLLALDDLEAAARHVAAMPDEWPPCAQCQDLYRLVYAEFYARSGQPDKAEAAAREVLREEAGRRLWFQGEAHYCLGLAALVRQDYAAAVGTLTTARDLLEEVGHVWTLAQTWKELGRAYALRGAPGDAGRANEAFSRARDLFVRHGASVHAARVETLIQTLPAITT